MPDPLLSSNIISLLGIEGLPDEQKIAIVEGMSQLVQERLLLKIMGILSEKDRNELLRLLDVQNQPEIDEFLQQHVPHMESLWEAEVLRIKAESADFMTSTLA